MERKFRVLIYENAVGRQPFNEWLSTLDKSSRGKVIARLDRLEKGLFGNAKSLKDKLYELKFTNPAFRIYYAMIGDQILLLLSGGDKSRQSQDILRAKEYLSDFRSRYED